MTLPALFLLLGCSSPDNQELRTTVIASPSEDFRRDLETVAASRLYFGHQSVGENILDGFRALLQEHPGVSLPLIDVTDSLSTPLPAFYFAHSFVGENNMPGAKCSDFVRTADVLSDAGLQVAILKFCFSDLRPETDVEGVFGEYRASVERLRSLRPGLKIVHVTVPLSSQTGGWRRAVNALIGRVGNNDMGNIRRQEFDALVKRHYPGDAVFDLARVESTYPDGSRETFEYGGTVYQALVPLYTHDGGHLNAVGRRRAAAELVRSLARMLRERNT